MMVIPVQALPNQQLQAQLGNQACTIELAQAGYGLFCTLYVSGSLIVASALCENLVLIVRDLYRGFVGDLCFIDTQGTADPVFTGLGSRYQLLYLAPGDLTAGEG